ncbi:hypothetical protein [Parasphingopyxis sp.]|uniref:hypothetical protein n=1 Tax=Parasphingopyxis sp. TaxID=1920299 RepID=UPI00260A90C2|nr:hypothetical protein [Parasphingopyxis sp.]
MSDIDQKHTVRWRDIILAITLAAILWALAVTIPDWRMYFGAFAVLMTAALPVFFFEKMRGR